MSTHAGIEPSRAATFTSAIVRRYGAIGDVALEGEVDLESLLAQTPGSFSVKGLFFLALVDRLSREAQRALYATLEAPPTLGRHLPMTSYPVRDYQRTILAVARAAHANVGAREGVRRVGRTVYGTFATSSLGRALTADLHEPGAALLRYPTAYHLAAKGGLASARRVGERVVVVRWDDYAGSSEFALGLLEGVVLHWGGRPRAEVEVQERARRDDGTARVGMHRIEIRW